MLQPDVTAMYRAVTTGWPSSNKVVLCYLAYLLAAAFGQWMMVVPGVTVTIWPPNGVILAMLLANPRDSWPWWVATAVAGELTANLIWFHNPLLPAIGYVIANVLEVLAGAILLGAVFPATPMRFAKLRQVLLFLVVGVFAIPAIGATIGSVIDVVTDKHPFMLTWPLWWLGDATGNLVATPLVLLAMAAWQEGKTPSPLQLIEGASIALLVVAIGVFLRKTEWSYAFLLFVPTMWAALRFEMRGAILTSLLLVVLIGVQARGDVQVASADVAYRQAMMQLLIIVAASTGLIAAVIIREYRQMLVAVTSANEQLEHRVSERTGQIQAAEQRFKATFENAAVGMSIVDANGVLIRVNDNLARMLGYEARELEGRPLDAFTHAEDLAQNHRAWAQLRSGDADQYELEKRYIRKDGEEVWGHTSVSCVRTPDGQIDHAIKVIQDVTERRRSDHARQLLMYELSHRSKNLLALVQAIARQTAAKTPQIFIQNFESRLRALAASQDLLVESGWKPVRLMDLLHVQLAHFGAMEERFDISGPPVRISAPIAQAIGMAVHELATNASKYGSLSNADGRVNIAWTAQNAEFTMSWIESGGPPVTLPNRRGFGSTVVDTLVASSLEGHVSIDFRPTGLAWEVRCPASVLRDIDPKEAPTGTDATRCDNTARERSLS